MSKSKKNVVDAETMLVKYGADTLRLMTLSDSPPERAGMDRSRIEGCYRFINRLFAMGETLLVAHDVSDLDKFKGHKLLKVIHETIKYTSEDIRILWFK
jgi:leucyl-tRNA synthetase